MDRSLRVPMAGRRTALFVVTTMVAMTTTAIQPDDESPFIIDESCRTVHDAINLNRRARPPYMPGMSSMEVFPRCRGEFNAPCSINWVWWLVQTVVERLENEDDIEAVLDNVTRGEYNRDFNYWPEIIDVNTGRFLASGAPADLTPRLGRSVDDVFTAESLTSQKGFWNYTVSRGDAAYFEFVGYDNYHRNEDGYLVGMKRIGFWQIPCRRDGRAIAVMAAYTNQQANDLAHACDSSQSKLCSINYAAQTVGVVVSDLLKANDPNEVRMILHDVSVGGYNKHSAIEAGCDLSLWGCFFPVITDSDGIIVSHGLDMLQGALLGKSVLDSPFDLRSFDSIRVPASSGGNFGFQYHTSIAGAFDDYNNISISFVSGVHVFGSTYYVYSPFLHRRGATRLAPYCTACSAFENYPCGWNNARVLLGYQQAMLVATPPDKFSEAWWRLTYDEEYAITTVNGKDFYAFAYDYNGTCVAHGTRPDFVGRDVRENLLPFIGDSHTVWQLHLRWIEASQTDAAAAIRYPWVDNEGKSFDKVVYVIQIARNGRNYYVAVGIGESQPELPQFKDTQYGYLSSEFRDFHSDVLVQSAMGLATFFFATAQNNTEFKQAANHVAEISIPARSSLLAEGYSNMQLWQWWDNSTNPFVLFVWAEAQDRVIIYDHEPAYVNVSLLELARITGTEQLNFMSMEEGDWQNNRVMFRKRMGAHADYHFVFYDTIDIADAIFDGRKDGVGERLHMAIFVRDRIGPPSATRFVDGCDAISAVVDDDVSLIPGDQCTCDGNIVAYDKINATDEAWLGIFGISSGQATSHELDLSCFEDKGDASALVDLYSMRCERSPGCDPGLYWVNGNCEECPKGKFRIGDPVDECQSCPPGRATNKKGSVQCTECGKHEYADEYGLESCKLCPDNTERFVSQTVQLEGKSISDCMCKVADCDDPPCKLPYLIEQIILENGAELDYYSRETGEVSAFNWPEDETGAYIPGFRQETGVACEECPEGAICLGGTNPPFPREGYNGRKWGEIVGIGNNASISGVDLHVLQNDWHPRTKFIRCNADWCNANFKCNARRRKNRLMCWAIAKGRVELFGEQWKCQGSRFARWFLTVFLFVAAITTFLFLNVIMGSFMAMDIFLNNTRNMSMIKDFTLSWPLDKKWLFSLDAWFTFLDISQIDVDIVKPTCISHSRFATQVTTQVCLFFVETLFYFGVPLSSTWQSHTTPLQPEVRESQINSAISRTLSMFTMMYPTLATIGFRGFACREFADGKMYLLADPDVLCWDSQEHKRLLALCSLVTSVVLAYPAVVFLQLRTLHRRNKLHSQLALERYGFLYEGYKLENYQWGAFQILKALVLCMIQVFLSLQPTMQVFAALNFLIFCVAAHFYYNPFLHSKSDHLEAFFLFATCTMIGIGSTFHTLDSEERDSTVEHVLYAMLHLLLFACVGISLWAVYVDVRERRLSAEARTRLLGLVNMARELEHKARCVSADDDVSSGYREFKAAEIHGTIKPTPLAKWVRTVSPHLLDDVEDSTNTQLLRDIGELDEWFGPALSDMGIASIFSNTEEAVFWRRIDLALPDLFEFLSSASTETIVNLKVTLGKLIGAYVHVPKEMHGRAKRVGYRDLIAKEDRGALLRGLILADEGHRRQFFRILDALAETTYGKLPPPRDLKGSIRRIPLGYEKNSGNHISSTVRRAIWMTSTQQSSSPRSLRASLSAASSLARTLTSSLALTSIGRESTIDEKDEDAISRDGESPTTTCSYGGDAKKLTRSLASSLGKNSGLTVSSSVRDTVTEMRSMSVSTDSSSDVVRINVESCVLPAARMLSRDAIQEDQFHDGCASAA